MSVMLTEMEADNASGSGTVPVTVSRRSLMLLLQITDSQFPAGRLVHSNGFESWVRNHPEATSTDIAAAVTAYVVGSVATLDLVFEAHAWRARSLGELRELDYRLWSYKTSPLARVSSAEPGHRLAETVQATGLVPEPAEHGAPSPFLHAFLAEIEVGVVPGNLAVVEGAVLRALDVPLDMAVLSSLRSVHAGVLSAIVRLGRLSAMTVQRMERDFADLADEVVDRVISTSLDDVSSSALDTELWGMRHTGLVGRLFRS